MGHSQLERLRGLLDAQSDERPEAQQEALLSRALAGETTTSPSGSEVTLPSDPTEDPLSARPGLNKALQAVLDKFTQDITAKAKADGIDPVFGRDNEIRQMVDILSRRRKNNPILVGEPGVGKTALVEGLALRIAEGNVPESLKCVTLRTLDLGLLQAGAGVKGEFEQRLKNIIEAVRQSPTPVLLFIDEAHTIIGAGNQAGGADAANLLKPALARGELRTIAATTWSEYKQYFERDAALERRFQMVKVDEPDDDTACLMLRGLKSRYAQHHGVHITDDAVKAAVTLSRRYLTGRQLPDKAVDLLDTASARVRMSLDTVPEPLTQRRARISALAMEKQALLEDIAMGSHTHSERLTEANNTRNVIRTPANNKLRMEDRRGVEHIKLSTEYGGKTQLNLGYNVDAGRSLRGEGAELRTDRWVSIRGGAGVFITADKQPSAGDKMLSMKEAIAQLENALSIARSLSDAAESADALPSDIRSQVTLTNALKDLVKPGMVLNAPEGVSITSPQAVRVASGSASVGIMSQQNTDISALSRVTVAAGEAVSVLAQQAGMKLFAAKGKVEIQAQDDALEALAKKEVTVTSTEGRVDITAATELVINCGGAYIRLSDGNIELGCRGNILLKSLNVQKMGPATLNVTPYDFPKGYGGVYTLKDEHGNIIPNTEYKITTGDGDVFTGVSDENGKTLPVYTAMPCKLNIEILGTSKSIRNDKT